MKTSTIDSKFIQINAKDGAKMIHKDSIALVEQIDVNTVRFTLKEKLNNENISFAANYQFGTLAHELSEYLQKNSE
jgi:hypothetical protein